ncbi:cell wall galactomannoprotein, partial [Mycena pura]
MVRLSRAFFVLSLFAASLSTPLKRDVVTVQNDITQKIGPQLDTLNNDLSGFPASGLTGAVAIQSDVQTLVSTVTATNNIQNTGSFSTVSGTAIIADFQALVPTFLATLVNFGDHRNAFAALPGGQAFILSELQSLNTAFGNYLDALKGGSPV